MPFSCAPLERSIPIFDIVRLPEHQRVSILQPRASAGGDVKNDPWVNTDGRAEIHVLLLRTDEPSHPTSPRLTLWGQSSMPVTGSTQTLICAVSIHEAMDCGLGLRG